MRRARTRAVVARLGRSAAALALLCGPVAGAWAATALQATRLVVAAEHGEASIVVRNDDPRPALMQVWIDDGRAAAALEELDVPLQVLQPLLRIEPHTDQAIRVRALRDDRLPIDHERLYWLNVMEIPRRAPAQGTAAAAQADAIEVAVRSRIKLIYRPAGLRGTLQEAGAGLRWQVLAGDAGVRVRNDSPRVVNLASGRSGDGRIAALEDGSVPPFGERTFQWEGAAAAVGKAGITYEWIDDLGQVHSQQTPP